VIFFKETEARKGEVEREGKQRGHIDGEAQSKEDRVWLMLIYQLLKIVMNWPWSSYLGPLPYSYTPTWDLLPSNRGRKKSPNRLRIGGKGRGRGCRT
jgi:hypothetical protein